jgi:S-adenosyl-L-methionine hydrolase (adenosine-forming)
MHRIVSLTTDFGLKDPYVAEMKAAILGICPDAVLVDVTHGVDKFNVRAGAFMLASAAPYFPRGSVHVAVVDPCVGTHRQPIIIETETAFFVGPDNGLLILAAESAGLKQMVRIESKRLMLQHVSSTFHGRDIFAPAAAHLANGASLEEFGPKITKVVKPEFTEVAHTKGTLVGEVLHVDDFGNIITNIHAKDISSFRENLIQVEVASHACNHMRLTTTYADAKLQEPIAIIGSHNYLEIALNQGDAAAKFGAKAGDKITVSRT